MFRLAKIVLVGVTCLRFVAARPPQALSELSLALPGITTASTSTTKTSPSGNAITYSPSTTSTSALQMFNLPNLSLPTALPNGNYEVLTAHTEKTQSALQLPTFAAETLSTTSVQQTPVPAIAVSTAPPDVAHQEESQNAVPLIAPHTAAQQDSAPVTTTPTSPTTEQVEALSVKINHGITVYVAHTEQSATNIQVPTYDAAVTSNNVAPTQAYNSINTPNSGAAGQTTNKGPQITSAPAVLYTSASGAVGLVAGSSPVIVGGTTYSLAAGGSALWINGVSTSLEATPVKSKDAGYASSGAAGVSGSSLADSTRLTTSTTSGSASVGTSSRSSGGASSTTPAAASATGAAGKHEATWSVMCFGLGIGVAGSMFF